MPQLHTFGNARGFVESEELQELACRKCDIHTFGATAQMIQSSTEDVGRPKLLFYEYAENRRVLNAPELCLHLSDTYRTWLFQEPPDLDFCSQVEAVQWADIILTIPGAHVEYERINCMLKQA